MLKKHAAVYSNFKFSIIVFSYHFTNMHFVIFNEESLRQISTFSGPRATMQIACTEQE